MFRFVFLATLLCALNASALVLDRMPFRYNGAAVYEWHGSICEQDTLPSLSASPLMLRIYTSGGYLTHLDELKSEIDTLARGRKLTVVFGECGSACVRLLAHVNKLARRGLLTLQVERGETVGFHGVSVGGSYDEQGTRTSIDDMIHEGMNPQWLDAHESYFELYGGTIQTVEYGDPDLDDAGLIDAATIVDPSPYRSLRSSYVDESTVLRSVDTSSGTCPKPSGELF